MRIPCIVLILIFLFSGCSEIIAPETPEIIISVQEGVTIPGLPGVRFQSTTDPLQVVRTGHADAAILSGVVPDGFAGFPLSVEEVVLMQGWLDQPLALTQAEGWARAQTWAPPGEPRPGAFARGRLIDLRPGWRAIPIDGVSPTPETIWSGRYPLAQILSVAYPSSPKGNIGNAIDQLRSLAQRPPSSWARLSVTGDFMLSRGVARAMREKGTLYPVEQVKAHLSTADITFANLESPIGIKGKPLPGKGIWFRAPPEAIDILKATGIDAVAVANNHIMDYDTENFLETLEILEEAGIHYVGGGRNLEAARQPVIVEAKGTKVAFLAYSQFADLFFDWNYPKRFAATASEPGVAAINEDWLREDIRRAREQAHIVAVAYHWGEEYVNYPSDEMRRLARLTASLGADLVLGYHPHAIQGFELAQGDFIVYSTGNFVMDWQDAGPMTQESMILDFLISPQGLHQVAVHPVWIQAEQPYIMSGQEEETLLQKMRDISDWK